MNCKQKIILAIENKEWHKLLVNLAHNCAGPNFCTALEDTSGVEALIEPGREQLLFVDGHNCHLEGAAELAKVMKERNPCLGVIFVGVFKECQPPFDGCLDMLGRGVSTKLRDCISGFFLKPTDEVLVLFTESGGVSMFLSAMSGSGYERNVHYNAFIRRDQGFENHIHPGRRQLLFIDLLSCDIKRTRDFVRRMKEKNPELVCVLYSPFKQCFREFSAQIDSLDEGVLDQFLSYTKDFLEGRWPNKTRA